MEITDLDLVPDACTLPTVERPLRLAEFDRLLGTATLAERLSPDHARITLPPAPEVAARAADLVVRETRCCSFFTFSIVATAGRLHLDVMVPPNQVPVLNALVARVDRTSAP